MMFDIYLYGMVIASTSFLLKNGFLKLDEYSEISEKVRLPGGETGTCATVLSSLGANVKVDGNHIGYNVSSLIKEFYKDKLVNLDSLTFDDNYDGLEDYIVISDEFRSYMGMFADYFTCGIKRWNTPKESDIINSKVAAIDPFFQDESQLAAELCVKHEKPYVTIDCAYDSYIHKNAAISVISGEHIRNTYPDKTSEDLLSLYMENGNGLTIITNGGNDFYYGKKGENPKMFSPFKVNVISTLGAGDSFKAGCVYGLLKDLNNDEIVEFASACSAVAISRFPLALNPPTINEIEKLKNQR